MKRIAAFLLLVFLVAGCATQLSAVQRAHATALRLTMDDGGSCSGTAIGPHALLSATHCFVGVQALAINGEPVVVTDAISDGHDHTILFVDRNFTNFATISQEPAQGDPVFILGNPSDLSDIFRAGHMAGSAVAGNARITLYDLQDFFGDSGSGIFNARGDLVGVVSVVRVLAQRDARIQFAGAFPMAFTPAQLELAREVDPGSASP